MIKKFAEFAKLLPMAKIPAGTGISYNASNTKKLTNLILCTTPSSSSLFGNFPGWISVEQNSTGTVIPKEIQLVHGKCASQWTQCTIHFALGILGSYNKTYDT